MNELLGAVNDLRKLGIGNPALLYRVENVSSKTYGCYRDDFYGLLSTDFTRALHTPTTESNWTPETNFGCTILEIIRSKYAGHYSRLLSCSAAEGKLQAALTMSKALLTDTSSKGPLMLIQHMGRTVAVQKNIDAPSVYALASEPELGLVAHTFSAAISQIRPSIIQTEEPSLFIEASVYKGFSPLRVAATVFSSNTLNNVACVTGLGSAASVPWSVQQIEETVNDLTERCSATFSKDMLVI